MLMKQGQEQIKKAISEAVVLNDDAAMKKRMEELKFDSKKIRAMIVAHALEEGRKKKQAAKAQEHAV